jgi:exopolyphosphatase/pppGpp-phosphohydrolase
MRKVMTPEECAAMRADNMRLKGKLRELSRRNKAEENEESRKTLVNNEDLSSLQIKVKKAEEAAKHVRESSRSFTAAADRWRSHRRLNKTTKVRSICIHCEQLRKSHHTAILITHILVSGFNIRC